MLSHSDLKGGVKIIIDNEHYEVLEAMPLKKAQRRVVIQSRLKNLLSGSISERNFHQGDTFEEAEIFKFEARFLYSHHGRFFFCDVKNPSVRFDFEEKQIGGSSRFLKPNQVVEGVKFEEKIISVVLPIKVQLKVMDAPPGIKGDRSQGGTKPVTVETNTLINVPLFVEAGDIIEINTETGEYVKRIE